MGMPMDLEGSCWEARYHHEGQSPGRDLPQAVTAHGQPGPLALPEDGVAFPHLGEFVQEGLMVLPPFARDLDVVS